MKKRVFSVFLVLAIVLSLAACGSKAESGQKSTGGKKLELPEFEIKSDKVTFLNYENRNALKDETSWWYKVNENLKENYNCELSFITTTYDNLTSKLTNLVLSGQSPDLVTYREQDLINFPKNNLVANVSEYIDDNSELWKALKDINAQLKYKGNQYLVSTYSKNDSYLFYWKSMFTDAGLSTPLELYRNGELTLSNFRQLIKSVTLDSNHDGVVDVFGLTVHPSEIFGCSGTDLVTIGQDGKYENNLRAKGHNALMNFFYDTGSDGDNSRIMSFDCKSNFEAKKAAVYWGCAWLTGEYLEKINDGTIEFSPSPHVDGTDKYYVDGRVDGYWIGENAPNLGGALAFCSTVRFMMIDEAYGKQDREESIKNGTALNDDAYKLVSEMNSDKFTQVNYIHSAMGNWGDNGAFDLWGALCCWNYPWETCVENYYPILQEQIDATNN